MRNLLLPLSWLYGAAVWLRNCAYDAGLFKIARTGVPVVSVGNLSAGGTGKSPIVGYIVNYYLAQHKKVAIVSRGYKRATKGTFIVSDGVRCLGSVAEAGDEPLLLARNHPGATVVVDEQRVRGVRAALECSHADVVILDDAFQHRAIARDLDILVLDATVPLATMRLLPTGLRREPFSAVKRAGLIAFSRALPSPDLRAMVASLSSAPVVSIRFVPAGLRGLGAPFVLPLPSLNGRRSVAFCGIGNPTAFRTTLEELGVVVLELLAFPDHRAYDAADLRQIAAAAERRGAELIVTTEKDAVRLQDEEGPTLPSDLPVAFVTIKAEVCEGAEALHALLDATLRRAA